jgi:hypothetical protein
MSQPLVSCLCVTRNRVSFLARSIKCFNEQTYDDRELVVVYESDDIETMRYLKSQGNATLKTIEVAADPKKTLGELRNISIESCAGDYICQWDDDDWYRQDRLAVQMEALLDSDKPACVLSRWLCIDVENKMAFMGRKRAWEGSLLCEKAQMISYPNKARGEDTCVVEAMLSKQQLVLLDRPEIYVYTFHGDNTWSRAHWQRVLGGSKRLSRQETERIISQTQSQELVLEATDISQYLAVTRRVCEQAMGKSRVEVSQTRYRFAGLPVRMRIAGTSLAKYMHNTFAHLSIDDDSDEPAALTIDMWDRSYTGVGCPGVPYVPDSTSCLDAGLITQYANGEIIRYERSQSVTCLDRPANHILSCRHDGDDLALYERSKPFPLMLATWYQDQGIQQLHAALVSRNGDGVLFIGKSGSGKSTCTLACVLADFDYLGDDYVGLEMARDDICIGHSYYNGARIDDKHLELFPQLGAHEIKPTCEWDFKSMVLMSDMFPQRMARSTTIKAVVMPHIKDQTHCRFTKASKVETLLNLAPSTLQLPLSAGLNGFTNLMDFIPRMPCFKMEIGTDVEQIPRCVNNILDEVVG